MLVDDEALQKRIVGFADHHPNGRPRSASGRPPHVRRTASRQIKRASSAGLAFWRLLATTTPRP